MTLEEQTHDPVNHPKHYTSDPSGVECIQITRHRNFNVGNAIKYLWRAGLKDDTRHIEDLRKAVWYIEDEIARLEAIEQKPRKDPMIFARELRERLSVPPSDDDREALTQAALDSERLRQIAEWFSMEQGYVETAKRVNLIADRLDRLAAGFRRQGPITPPSDDDRETLRDELAGWVIGAGYYQSMVGTSDAAEMADAILAAGSADRGLSPTGQWRQRLSRRWTQRNPRGVPPVKPRPLMTSRSSAPLLRLLSVPVPPFRLPPNRRATDDRPRDAGRSA